jgi:hypothetical protein
MKQKENTVFFEKKKTQIIWSFWWSCEFR